MAHERLSVRKIREILRLRYEAATGINKSSYKVASGR
jgi:hypothetical protein